jgi:hypothetical protein
MRYLRRSFPAQALTNSISFVRSPNNLAKLLWINFYLIGLFYRFFPLLSNYFWNNPPNSMTEMKQLETGISIDRAEKVCYPEIKFSCVGRIVSNWAII